MQNFPLEYFTVKLTAADVLKIDKMINIMD